MDKFSRSDTDILYYYVYVYIDPTNDEIFYVGKGKGNRVFSHLNDLKETEKTKYIRNLKMQGIKPRIEIIIHGIPENIALRVEAAIIDLLGIENLTNRQLGFKSASFGRMTTNQIESLYAKNNVDVDDSVILIRISQAFRYSMSAIQLYDYTRGHWKLKRQRAEQAKYALSIYQGVVQEVYEILQWFEANKTFSVRVNNELIERDKDSNTKGRYEFVGNIAPDNIRKKYKYKSVSHYFKKGASNPILYLNC